jgi:hypothetical protein
MRNIDRKGDSGAWRCATSVVPAVAEGGSMMTDKEKPIAFVLLVVVIVLTQLLFGPPIPEEKTEPLADMQSRICRPSIMAELRSGGPVIQRVEDKGRSIYVSRN